MPDILTQSVAVNYQEAQGGVAQRLMYRQSALPERPPPLPIPKMVPGWPAVQLANRQLRDKVKRLIGRARYGQNRQGVGVEPEVHAISTLVLPNQGFAGMMEPGVHPQLDIVMDAASEIAWETLAERYRQCPNCDFSTPPWPAPGASEIRFCPNDGTELEAAGGPLAVTYHLAHLIRGEGQSGAVREEFLFIENPTGDLCNRATPGGAFCDDHLRKLQAQISGLGFTPTPISGKNATVGAVMEALSADSLGGVYYFGHGCFPEGGTEGYLQLADGPLYASQIQAIAPKARFAFLNACQGAATGDNWDLDRRAQSVAEAFCWGDSSKVVIAPIWPVVNVQAAESALTFFREACAGKSLAEALREVRVESLKQYEEHDKPHLSWMAYRYFGDPNEAMPVPAWRQTVADGPQVTVPAGSVFKDDGKLDKDLFTFDIGAVLLRAAKRRNSQDRALVNVVDLTAGLIRKGNLTRFVLRRLGVDPDRDYATISKRDLGGAKGKASSAETDAADGEGAGESREDRLRRLLDRWVVRKRDQFDDEVVAVFDRALALFKCEPGAETAPRITERQLLEALTHAPEWDGLAVLPSGGDVQTEIHGRSGWPRLDDNGCLVLLDLDAGARKVIETAHVLAQQRGVFPISNRLMLAGLLADTKSYAARVFLRAEIDPEVISALMISATEERAADSFGLSPEACQRIVLPVLERARALAPPDGPIAEAHVFQAYCEKADPGLKAALRRPPLAFDLDRLKTTEPVSMEKVEERAAAAAAATAKELEQTTGERDDGSAERGEDTPVLRESDFEASAWQVVTSADALARREGWSSVRSPHLFAAMVASETGPIAASLRERGQDPSALARQILALAPSRGPAVAASERIAWSSNALRALKRSSRAAKIGGREKINEQDLLAGFFADGGGAVGEAFRRSGLPVPLGADGRVADVPARETGRSALATFGNDLTEKARQGTLPRIVGRDAEITQAIHTLQLTENANPLLVGDAGVGKTAIVEGIARQIAEGHCPPRLRSARVIELSAGSLVADTPYRGDFEKRMQQLLVEAGRADVILFIDEIHTMVGAGQGERSGPDAGNMLKASLARGEIRLIGATTYPEFRRTIARDKALSRRFQVQMIKPPSREATLEVLAARQAVLETHHGVRVTDQARAAAVDLSERYIVDKQWPAKARDVLERACVLASSETDAGEPPVEVRAEHVASVVSTQTGIPLGRLADSDQRALDGLEARIGERIIGQQVALDAVARAVRRGRQGLAGEGRPWGVFLFVGAPGVGKTELAKVLAEEVYGGDEALIRFDMGDFSEPHSTARLVGAPPGYVGYDQGAPLVERLRVRPYSLLLFDEIEHAHPSVRAVLLRLLSEGTIEDTDGVVADARNALVILTSNVLDPQRGGSAVGFAAERQRSGDGPGPGELRSLLRDHLSDKLLDRLDAIVCFEPLTPEALADIAGQKIAEVARRAADQHGVEVAVDREVLSWVADRAAREGPGARSIQRVVDREVTPPMGDYLSHAPTDGPQRLRLCMVGDAVQVRPETAGD